MGCLGVHFALSSEDLSRVLAAEGDDGALLDLIQEDIEERYLGAEDGWSFQTDKAWDAMHRCLTNGKLEYDSGPYPVAYAVLGGRPLYSEEDYIVCLVEPENVAPTASALKDITKDTFRARYFGLNPKSYGLPLSEDDFEYTWSNFEGLPEFFARAAAAGRAVIFTADQ